MKSVKIVILFLGAVGISYLYSTDTEVTNYGRKVAGSTPLARAPRERVGTYYTLFRSGGLPRTSSTVRSERFRRKIYAQEHLGTVKATPRHPYGRYHELYHQKQIVAPK